MHGPYVIVCRGHSGGRVLCEAFVRNHIAMGELVPESWDTRFFAPAGNLRMQEIIRHAFDYPTLDSKGQDHYRDLLRHTLGAYIENHIADPEQPFGWKFGASVFAVPVILDTYPSARVVHLIRDGRDVMLSRLDARFGERFTEPFNKVMIFGTPDVSHYRGRPLDATTVAAFREELELLHWVTAVEYGLRGRAYPDRYLEVKYEALCREPVRVFGRIFSFLQVPFEPQVRERLAGMVHSSRIGKWRGLPAERLARAYEIGGPLLKKLGYLSDD